MTSSMDSQQTSAACMFLHDDDDDHHHNHYQSYLYCTRIYNVYIIYQYLFNIIYTVVYFSYIAYTIYNLYRIVLLIREFEMPGRVQAAARGSWPWVRRVELVTAWLEAIHWDMVETDLLCSFLVEILDSLWQMSSFWHQFETCLNQFQNNFSPTEKSFCRYLCPSFLWPGAISEACENLAALGGVSLCARPTCSQWIKPTWKEMFHEF